MTRVDQEAVDAFAADPDPGSLASARIAVQHLEHHGQPLQHTGTTYTMTTARFVFRCHACPARVEFFVSDPTGDDE